MTDCRSAAARWKNLLVAKRGKHTDKVSYAIGISWWADVLVTLDQRFCSEHIKASMWRNPPSAAVYNKTTTVLPNENWGHRSRPQHKHNVISFLLLNSAVFQWNKNVTFTKDPSWPLSSQENGTRTSGRVCVSVQRKEKAPGRGRLPADVTTFLVPKENTSQTQRCQRVFSAKSQAAFIRSQSGGSCEQTP